MEKAILKTFMDWTRLRNNFLKTRSNKDKGHIKIRYSLQVAENDRFVIKSVYSRGSTMVAKPLNFRLPGSLKMRSESSFAFPSYP